MNIRLRLTLWYMAILFLILVIFGAVVYIGLNRSLVMALDNHLQREAEQVIGNIKFDGANEREEYEDDEEGQHKKQGDDIEIKLRYIPEEGIFWRILDPEGRPLTDPGYFDGASFDSVITQTIGAQLEYATLANNTPIRLYTAPFVIEQQGAGVIQIAESYQHIQEVQRQLIVLLALSIPFTLLAASVGGWFLATSALAPIDRITRAARQISADDLHQRLHLKLPNDELGRLADTFDQMLARLEDAFERQKRFIADASHEMRTPLTILKGDVEVALNRPRSVTEYRETLEMINQTADRLTTLVEDLFLLARADNNQYPLQLKRFNLSELLTKEAANLMPSALKKNIALNLDIPDVLPIEADPIKLARLFINLIHNAIKYSGPGGAVNITAISQDAQVCITIADTGPGIPAEHLPYLFERFYRVDKARSRGASDVDGSSGGGLGLAIADRLVKAHGGRIEVTSEVGQGTAFIVWLPSEASVT